MYTVRTTMPEPAKSSPPASDAATTSVTVTFEGDGCVMGYWREVFIVVWATQATLEHMTAFGRLAERMVGEHGKASTIQVLTPGSTVPTPDARAELNGLSERYADRLICCAAPLEGAGFWASTMRSFLTGLQLFTRSRFRTKICATLEEGVQWLASLHPLDEQGSAELLAAATELRRRPSVARTLR